MLLLCCIGMCGDDICGGGIAGGGIMLGRSPRRVSSISGGMRDACDVDAESDCISAL